MSSFIHSFIHSFIRVTRRVIESLTEVGNYIHILKEQLLNTNNSMLFYSQQIFSEEDIK